jgi:D-alanyl-D-alanine carboxypeptidase/D-alanyl-D-alanine-endopeptidase (penicillin-binding protein 4)
MSIVGVDGTAATRMLGTPVVGNAHVKTGTVRNCRSLSGYVTDRAGHMLAFVILMNNHLLSAHGLGLIQDQIVERLQQQR